MKFNGIPAKSAYVPIVSGFDDPLIGTFIDGMDILSVVPLVDGRHLLVIYKDESVNEKVADELVELKDKSDSDNTLSSITPIEKDFAKEVVTQKSTKAPAKKPSSKNTSRKKT